MKYIIYIIVFILLVSSANSAPRKATDFSGTYSSYDDPGDPLYHLYHHRFHYGNIECVPMGWLSRFENKNRIFASHTGKDGAGEDIDSIMFFIDSVDASFNVIWGVFQAHPTASNILGAKVATQDNPMAVSSRGLKAATGWTMLNVYWKNDVSYSIEGNCPGGCDSTINTLQDYTKYWIIMESDIVESDNVWMPFGDIQNEDGDWHWNYLFDSVATDYDGVINDSADFYVLGVLTGTTVERMPVYMEYNTVSATPPNLVKTISGITSSQFSLNLDWDNDEVDIKAQLYGCQGVWWIQDFPSFSIHVIDDQIWGTADSERVIDFTERPPSGTDTANISSWWSDTLALETNYDFEPGLPYKGYIALQYNNGDYWVSFFIDTFFTVRVKNIWPNNLVLTDTMGTDSISLWAHPAEAGAFNPTQEDSITIKTGDTLHVIQPTYSTGDCLIDVEGADFDDDSDTTFAHLGIESGGVFKMHGGTRVNILTYDFEGTVIMEETDTIAVWDADTLIYLDLETEPIILRKVKLKKE